MKISSALALATLLAACAPSEPTATKTANLAVSSASSKGDMVQLASTKPNLEVFVDRSTIEDFVYDDLPIRQAVVAYHLITPVMYNGKMVHYVHTAMSYQCATSLYLTSEVVFAGKDAEVITSNKRVSDAAEALPGTQEHAIMKYVCEYKLTTKPTEIEKLPSAPGAKPGAKPADTPNRNDI